MSMQQQRIEEYLRQVRSRLRGLREEEVVEIIAELRSHIVERATPAGDSTVDGVSAALGALGDPEDLAREYVKDEVLARVETSRSPLRLLDSLFGWATVSAAGFLVLMVTLSGYLLGAVFVLVALLKPFHPATAGLWVLRDSAADLELSVRLGFGTAPSSGRELFGWWVVPLGLLVGCGLIVLMTRLALWCVSIYRRARPLRGRL